MNFRFYNLLAALLLLSAQRARAQEVTPPVQQSLALDSLSFPEGLDYHARDNAYYITSIRHRTIARIDTKGTRELIARNTPGIGAIMSVAANAAGDKVWATTVGLQLMEGYVAADSAIAALLLIRVADGVIEKKWDLPAQPRKRIPGEVAIGTNGLVYITDSSNPTLYEFDPATERFSVVTSPLFRSLQGIAIQPGSKSFFIADYARGILKFDTETRIVSHVSTAADLTVRGCDGIAAYNASLICVQNGIAPPRVVQFVFDSTGTSITALHILDENNGIADEPTNGKMVGSRFVYIANSQWEKRDPQGIVKAGAALKAPILLSIPVR